MLLAIALYLYDSLLLMASHEAVVVRGWRGRWASRFGANRWKLAGKEPWLPNPLTPHRPFFRLAWSFEGGMPPQSPASATPLHVASEIDRLRPFVWVSMFCLFVLLPIGLFFPVGLAFTAGTVALLYLNNAVALGWVSKRRQRLHLSARQFGGLAFECLVCPPFSINLVRKLCARMPVGEDFTVAAKRLLPPDALAEAHAQCLLRLEEQLAYAPEDSVRMRALVAAKTRFAPTEENNERREAQLEPLINRPLAD